MSILVGQDAGSDSGGKEHGLKGKVEGCHRQENVRANKGVIGICFKNRSRHKPLPEWGIYELRQLEAS